MKFNRGETLRNDKNTRKENNLAVKKIADDKSQISRSRMSVTSKALGGGPKPQEILEKEVDQTKIDYHDVKNE